MAAAVVGPDAVLERATLLFLDCCGDADAFLLARANEIETVLGGDAFHATAMLASTTVEFAAVTDRRGRRCALLRIAPPAYDGADYAGDALLGSVIEASPAIVWLKDLEGRYLRVNRQYVEQLQISAERVCGRTDDELESGESLERSRLQGNGKRANEPLELEYMVDAAGSLPAFKVVRFALRNLDGDPSALCGVAAPLVRGELASSEYKRFTRLARWRDSDESAIRAGLITEWGLTPLSDWDGVRSERPHAEQETTETDSGQFAALAAELDAALETSARLDLELAEERRQVMVLREASVVSARRAQELLRSVTSERTRTAELEESLARAEGRAAELERERDSERSRAERAEVVSADAATHEHEIAETLRAELAASREELERLQTAAREAAGQLEAERAGAHKAKLAAEKAQAELATTSAALAREQRSVETLRDDLRAAEEEAGRVSRAASEAAAQAPTQDELEQERRRADRANAALTSLRAKAEMAEAEAKSILAQARSELRRSNEEAAAASEALTAEKQHVASLRGELTEVRDELEATRRELSQRPTAEQLEQARSRAERERSRADQQPVEQLRSELVVLRGELEGARRELAERPTSEELESERSRAQREADESSNLLAAERQTVELLRRQMAAIQEELEQTRHAAPVAVVSTSAASDELERAQTRAETAEAELRSQRVLAEQAAASAEEERMKAAAAVGMAEEERMKAAAAVGMAETEREAAQALRAELASAQTELASAEAELASAEAELASAEAELEREREHSEASITETDGSQPDPEAPPADEPAPGSPIWQPASQRALAAALAAVDDWRGALEQTVKIVGDEGGWDAVVARCPEKRRKFMQCVAMWGAEATISSAFETRVWQHRPKLPDERGSAWRPPAPATATIDLETAEDALLRAAAAEDIGSTVLVPIHDGTQLIGTLELMSRQTTPPSVELMLSLEGIALQLVAIARLLEARNTPQWRAAGF